MGNKVQDELKRPFMSNAGWLFADLLLALAMLFLVANTITQPRRIAVADRPKPQVTPTAMVIATPTPDPTPTFGQRIVERNFCRITLTNNNQPDELVSNLNFAEKILEPQINAIGFLKGRKVGTVIAYGGVDNIADPADQGRGASMAAQTYKVLKDLEQKNPGGPFGGASYYDSLFTGYVDSGHIRVDVYLIERQKSTTETCNSDHNPI